MKSRTLMIVMAVMIAPLSLASQTLLFSENFDTYTAGAYLAVSNPQFQTWTNSPGGIDDVHITNERANSLPNAVKFYATTPRGDGDVVWLLDNKIAGHYKIEFKIFVEDQIQYGGYFNILHAVPPAPEWAIELSLLPDLNIEMCVVGAHVIIGTYAKGVWNNFRIEVNLNDDQANFYLNDVFLYQWQYSLMQNGTQGMNVLAGVDFYTYAGGDPNSQVYFFVDDLKFTQITYAGLELPMQSELRWIYPNPVSDIITLNAGDATEVEIYSVAGQFLARLPLNGGTCDLSVLAPGVYGIRTKTKDSVFQSKVVKQ